MTQTQLPVWRGRRISGGARLSLVLVLLCFLVPPALAWWFLHWSEYVHSGEKSNYGTLVVPMRQLQDQPLIAFGEAVYSAPERRLYGRWSLLHIVPPQCAKSCREQAQMLWQIERLLGKDSLRVQRIVQQQASATAASGRLAGHSGQWRFSAAAPVLRRLREGGNILQPGRVYLIDPLGNIMMYYPKLTDDEPAQWVRGVIQDVRRLLKASRLG